MSSLVSSARQWRPTGAVRFAVLGGVAVVVAALVAVSGAPVAIRTFVCLPVLLGVGGVAVARLLLGDRFAGLDGLTRGGGVALAGFGLLLAAGLFSAVVLGGGLPAYRVIVVDAGLTLVALGGYAGRGGVGPVAAAGLRPPGSVLVSVLVVALLVGALIVGRLLVPAGSPTPTLALTGAVATADGPVPATAGAAVPLDLRLRHVRTRPTDGALRVVVDGRPTAVTGTLARRADGDYAGTATVTAPAAPGVHRVVVAVELPGQRLELVTYLAVHAR